MNFFAISSCPYVVQESTILTILAIVPYLYLLIMFSIAVDDIATTIQRLHYIPTDHTPRIWNCQVLIFAVEIGTNTHRLVLAHFLFLSSEYPFFILKPLTIKFDNPITLLAVDPQLGQGIDFVSVKNNLSLISNLHRLHRKSYIGMFSLLYNPMAVALSYESIYCKFLE